MAYRVASPLDPGEPGWIRDNGESGSLLRWKQHLGLVHCSIMKPTLPVVAHNDRRDYHNPADGRGSRGRQAKRVDTEGHGTPTNDPIENLHHPRQSEVQLQTTRTSDAH